MILEIGQLDALCCAFGSGHIRLDPYNTFTVNLCSFSSSGDIALCRLCHPPPIEGCRPSRSINATCSLRFVFLKLVLITYTAASHVLSSSLGELVRNILPTISSMSDSSDTHQSFVGWRHSTYPVAFSNMPRAWSVTFSFMPRCLVGSTLPWPYFFSTVSRPEWGGDQ